MTSLNFNKKWKQTCSHQSKEKRNHLDHSMLNVSHALPVENKRTQWRLYQRDTTFSPFFSPFVSSPFTFAPWVIARMAHLTGSLAISQSSPCESNPVAGLWLYLFIWWQINSTLSHEVWIMKESFAHMHTHWYRQYSVLMVFEILSNRAWWESSPWTEGRDGLSINSLVQRKLSSTWSSCRGTINLSCRCISNFIIHCINHAKTSDLCSLETVFYRNCWPESLEEDATRILTKRKKATLKNTVKFESSTCASLDTCVLFPTLTSTSTIHRVPGYLGPANKLQYHIRPQYSPEQVNKTASRLFLAGGWYIYIWWLFNGYFNSVYECPFVAVPATLHHMQHCNFTLFLRAHLDRVNAINYGGKSEQRPLLTPSLASSQVIIECSQIWFNLMQGTIR